MKFDYTKNFDRTKGRLDAGDAALVLYSGDNKDDYDKIDNLVEKSYSNVKDTENQETTNQKLWRHDNLTIMKVDLPNKKNTINDGAYFNGGMVYPVKMIAPNGEATYPQVMLNNNVEAEEALNKLLWEEAENYIRLYLRGQADLAYNVIRKDSKLLSIQLISGKDTFVHHNINIIPGEKKKTEMLCHFLIMIQLNYLFPN